VRRAACGTARTIGEGLGGVDAGVSAALTLAVGSPGAYPRGPRAIGCGAADWTRPGASPLAAEEADTADVVQGRCLSTPTRNQGPEWRPAPTPLERGRATILGQAPRRATVLAGAARAA
jgi:hypothetical protein